MTPMINTDDLLDAQGVAALLGLRHANSVHTAIPALALPAVRGRIETGDVIDWSLAEGRFTNVVSKGEQIMVPPVSGLLLDILTAGGWSNYVRDAVTA